MNVKLGLKIMTITTQSSGKNPSIMGNVTTMDDANLNRLVFEQIRMGVDQATIKQSLIDIGVNPDYAQKLIVATDQNTSKSSPSPSNSRGAIVFAFFSMVTSIVITYLIR